MKKYLIILTAFLFAFSCSDDRDISEPEQPYDPLSVNTFDLYTDGKKFDPERYYINAHYPSCGDDIDLSVVAFIKGFNTSINIDFKITKYGQVKSFFIHGQGYYHYTPFYNPNDYLKINNLHLDIENQYLKFSFEGNIYKEYTDEPMEINGNFEIKYFSPSYCYTYTQFIHLSDGINYDSFDISRKITSSQGQIINVKYEANSPDGWQFVLNGLKKNIYEMDLGTYEFDFLRENEFIELNKYIGQPKTILYTVTPEDWLNYDTSGSFTITKHELIDGHKVTKGTINLNAYENGVLIKSFQNAPFELSDEN